MSRFILITGRTVKQGTALHIGKGSNEYLQATTFVAMSRADMDRLGAREGQPVRVRTAFGEVQVAIKEDDLPTGILFMSMGPVANMLVGAETYGTGMPDSKGLEAEVELS